MSTLTFYSKIELLPEHLQQQVLDYIEFLLSRELKKKSVQKTDSFHKNEPKSRFSGRISAETAQQLQQQLQEMRAEWR